MNLNDRRGSVTSDDPKLSAVTAAKKKTVSCLSGSFQVLDHNYKSLRFPPAHTHLSDPSSMLKMSAGIKMLT